MSETNSPTKSLETFRLLYPIFKEEVYRRRCVIGQISRYGALFFLSISVFVFHFEAKSEVLASPKLYAVGGVMVSLALLIYQLIQEKSRHEQAKLQLITLEKGLGFFEAGSYLPNQPLYPEAWEKRPKLDAGLALSILCLSGTAFFLILMILSR